MAGRADDGGGTASGGRVRARKQIFANGETLREYLDVEIGRAVLGDPSRTLIEVSEALGNITRAGVFYAERRILRKVGVLVRTSAEIDP